MSRRSSALIESLLMSKLNCKEVRAVGTAGTTFEVDGRLVFIKKESSPNAGEIISGQFESLKIMRETSAIRVPEPLAIIEESKESSTLVMEFLDLHSLGHKAGELGQKIAKLHMHNIELGEKGDPRYVSKFGFHIPTACGIILQGNEWDNSWPSFYRNKLQEQMALIEARYSDKEARQLWSELKENIATYFSGIEIRPSLLHGDLWSGNAYQTDGEAVVIDPGCFYGHHEFELGIAGMFGMPPQFFSEYHKIFPKERGFNKRHKLYQLFHYLNHWNHFGGSYRMQSIDIMKTLTNSK